MINLFMISYYFYTLLWAGFYKYHSVFISLISTSFHSSFHSSQYGISLDEGGNSHGSIFIIEGNMTASPISKASSALSDGNFSVKLPNVSGVFIRMLGLKI